MVSEQFIDWVLETGEDDEVQFADLDWLLQEDTGITTDRVSRTVDAAIELIDQELLIPGDMVDYRFQPWSGTRDEIVQRLRAGQDKVESETGRFLPGDICVFRTSNYAGA